MIIFLYGPDDCRRERKKRSIIDEFGKKHGVLNKKFFDFSDTSVPPADALGNLGSFVRVRSIFEKEKLGVLEACFSLPEKYLKELARLLKNACGDESTTILLSERYKSAKGLNLLPSSSFMGQNFEYLRGYEWEKFIILEARKNGLRLGADAVRWLAKAYEDNTWGLVTELEKISFLETKDKRQVEIEDLERLGLEVVPEFWATLGGLKSGNIALRLASLEAVFCDNDPPVKVFNILASSWTQKIRRMAEYDLLVKSGKLDYEEALLDLAIS